MAPMQCYTNRFFRYLLRRLSSKAITWTEMEKASDILLSDSACERRLRHSADEGPMAVLQLGGSDVGQMARAAALGSKYGFGEININCGCPSIETGGADYGAALMSRADTVRQVCDAVAEESGLPVSIKVEPSLLFLFPTQISSLVIILQNPLRKISINAAMGFPNHDPSPSSPLTVQGGNI
jgi:tRNA-dihydrouridine synthase A